MLTDMTQLRKPNQPSTSESPNPEDQKKRDEMQRRTRFTIPYLIGAFVLIWLFQDFVLAPLVIRSTQIPYSEFKQKLSVGEITEVVVGTNLLVGTFKNPDAKAKPEQKNLPFTTTMILGTDLNLLAALEAANVKFEFQKPASGLGSFLLSWLFPLALLGGFYYLNYRRLGAMGANGGGLGGIFSVGKSKAVSVKSEEIGVTFKDVGGADEAITELQEIIAFLKRPKDFEKLGGRIPKGVLLLGPPGTGKTLLAKATAGEAGVAFFETSGSEFVEMFVGVGAARVRDLFEQARKAAPAIIFIDEIDAIGQARGGINMGGNDEREQTLNQLLSEIDGFKVDLGAPVIFMAATNRPEVLDQALLRAGRFDRQITVDVPDLIGRAQILKIHVRGLQLEPGFDLERAARITPGMTGADLANVLNEAALLAARRQATAIAFKDFEAAIERVVVGLERKSRLMNESERTRVAYHESGHAMVANLVPHGDPVSKISIVPHGRGALGYTLQMPTEDRYLLTTDELEDRLCVMLGGRAAEQVVFQSISTGAADDIQRASELARRMVSEFGMSAKLGSVRYAGPQMQYLRGIGQADEQLSPETRKTIDSEVQRLITEQFDRATTLLGQHRSALETLAQGLLKLETLEGGMVKQALDQEAKPQAVGAGV